MAVAHAEFGERLDVLNELSAQARVFDGRASHPWRGFAATAVTVTEREQLQDDLGAVLAGAKRLLVLIPGLDVVIETNEPSVSDLRRLQRAFTSVVALDRLPLNWFDQSTYQLEEKAKLFETAGRLLSDFEQQHSSFARVFDLQLDEARRLLEPVVHQFSRWYQRVSPAYWKWKSNLLRKVIPGTKITHATAQHLYAIVLHLLEINGWREAHKEEISAEVGATSGRDRDVLLQAAWRCHTAAALIDVIAGMNKTPARQNQLTDQFRHAVREDSPHEYQQARDARKRRQ